MRLLRLFLLASCASLVWCCACLAQSNPEWTTSITPFRIADGLYYVGSRDLAAYLVVTPAGDILINSNLPSSPPQIRHSVEQLGFHWNDIKILLISHAHFDHAGGSAEILKQTGAKFEVMDRDVSAVESGGRTDFAYGPKPQFAPAHVSRVLHDRDVVSLGGVTLTAHLTPGHTQGCTTWTMQAHVPGEPPGVRRNIVIVGSWNVNPGFRLVTLHGKPPSYPGIARDFQTTFTVLDKLPCDIFLGAHGSYFNMLPKLARMPAEGDRVWLDPEGYRHAVAEHRQAFEAELQRQHREGSAAR